MKKIVAYFPEWGRYEAHDNYTADKISWEQITHLNYAFIDIDMATNKLQLFDAYGFNLNMPEINRLKKQHPHVKVMMSIGGWSRSAGFHNVALTEANRETFANSCVDFIKEYDFDGVDIDWEYPTFVREGDVLDNPNDLGTPSADIGEKETFTLLLKTIREKLDDHTKVTGKYYPLTIAVSINPNIITNTEPDKFINYIDFINVMSYDMHGAFEPITGHHSPLFSNPYEPYTEMEKTYFNTVAALEFYRSYGIPSEKLILGVPFYSRGWGNVSSDYPIKNKLYNGTPISLPGLFAEASVESVKGKWDGGRNAGNNPYDYIENVMLGAGTSFVKYRDPWSKTPYIYSASKREMYTYEDVESVVEKMKFVNENNYGGVIIWELSGDTTNNMLTAINQELFNSSDVLGDGTIEIESEGPMFEFTPKITVGDKVLEIPFNNKVSVNVPTGTYEIEMWTGRTSDYQTVYVPSVSQTFVEVGVGETKKIKFSYKETAGEPVPTTINAFAKLKESADYGTSFQYEIEIQNKDTVKIDKDYELTFTLENDKGTLGDPYNGAMNSLGNNKYKYTPSEWSTGIPQGTTFKVNGDGAGLLKEDTVPKKMYLNGERIGVIDEKVFIVSDDISKKVGSLKIVVENSDFPFTPILSLNSDSYNVEFGCSLVIPELYPGVYSILASTFEDDIYEYKPTINPVKATVTADTVTTVTISYIKIEKENKGSVQFNVHGNQSYEYVPQIMFGGNTYNVAIGESLKVSNLSSGEYPVVVKPYEDENFKYNAEVTPSSMVLVNSNEISVVDIYITADEKITSGDMQIQVLSKPYDFLPKVYVDGEEYEIAFGGTKFISGISTGIHEVQFKTYIDETGTYIGNVLPSTVIIKDGETTNVTVDIEKNDIPPTECVNVKVTTTRKDVCEETYSLKVMLDNKSGMTFENWVLDFDFEDEVLDICCNVSIEKDGATYRVMPTGFDDKLEIDEPLEFVLLVKRSKVEASLTNMYINNNLICGTDVKEDTGIARVIMIDHNFDFMPVVSVNNKSFGMAFGTSKDFKLTPGEYQVFANNKVIGNKTYTAEITPVIIEVEKGVVKTVTINYKEEVTPVETGTLEIIMENKLYDFTPVVTVEDASNESYAVPFGTTKVVEGLMPKNYEVTASSYSDGIYNYTPLVTPTIVNIGVDQVTSVNIAYSKDLIIKSDGTLLLSVVNEAFDFVPEITVDNVIYNVEFGTEEDISLKPNMYNITAKSYEDDEYTYEPTVYPEVVNIVENGFTTATIEYVSKKKDPEKSIIVELIVGEDWGTGYNFIIKITNNTDTVLKDWILDFDFDDTITQIWNATYSSVGNHYTITPPEWGKDIGSKMSYEIGGGANRNVQDAKLYNIEINGDHISPIDPTPEQKYGNIQINVSGEDFGLDTTVIVNGTKYELIKYNEPLLITGLLEGSYSIIAEPKKDSSYNYTPTVISSPAIVVENTTTQTTITYEKTSIPTVDATYPDYTTVDAGQGHRWGDNVFSPFVDSTIWYTTPSYSGLFPFGDEFDRSGAKLVNLGFVVADKDGNPSWGTYYDIAGNDPNTGSIIRNLFKQIKTLREKGGDVLVSFGGEDNTPIHSSIKDVNVLAEHYIRFVSAFGLKNIDFDIEGMWVRDKESWERNNDAIKIMQDRLGEDAPDVWFTFPVLPSGLVGKGTGNDAYHVLEDAVKKGVKVRGVNIMTMCFGYAIVTDPSDMSIPVIQASESLKNQIMEIYTNNGVTITESEAYRMVGLTPMIGVSYQPQEIFTVLDAQKVLEYAQTKGIGMLSYWALTRDKTGSGSGADLATGSQIPQKDYEFALTWNKYNN